MPKKHPVPAAISRKPYVAIPMAPVESKQVAAIGYDAASKTLAVSFNRSPHIYHYSDVPAATHAAFMAAESKGVYFGTHIKALHFEKFAAPEAGAAFEQPAEAPATAPVLSPANFAQRLHGVEYSGEPIPKHIQGAAHAAGIVIVVGASDDLMEFYGAIRDEASCPKGGTILVDTKGTLPDWDFASGDEQMAKEYLSRKEGAKSITALWCPQGEPAMSWAYTTDIPHATFDVMEDGEVYCRGIVFAVADLAG